LTLFLDIKLTFPYSSSVAPINGISKFTKLLFAAIFSALLRGRKTQEIICNLLISIFFARQLKQRRAPCFETVITTSQLSEPTGVSEEAAKVLFLLREEMAYERAYQETS
jgi:hypothetical protein